MRGRCLTLAISLSIIAGPVDAQLSISGQADFVALSGYDNPLNQAFRGDDPFNEVRLRIYGQHWVNDRIGVFTELLMDMRADARVNGAYVVINRIADKDWLDARIGMAPSPLGNFGKRSTYFNQNSVVGVPLLWQYRTALDGGGQVNPQEVIARRDANNRGLPMMYDACWPILAELSGAVGMFEYSVGGTAGAVSNPQRSLRVPGWQVLSRVGIQPMIGLTFGISAAYGPYIGEAYDPLLASPPVVRPQDEQQVLFGYDFEYARGRLQLFSEGFVNRWDTRFIPEGLKLRSGYVEARVDVSPQLYVGGRIGGMDFSAIDVAGQPENWDDDLWRWESAIGYRMAREVSLRLAWQHWHYTSGIDANQNVLALQLSAVF